MSVIEIWLASLLVGLALAVVALLVDRHRKARDTDWFAAWHEAASELDGARSAKARAEARNSSLIEGQRSAVQRATRFEAELEKANGLLAAAADARDASAKAVRDAIAAGTAGDLAVGPTGVVYRKGITYSFDGSLTGEFRLFDVKDTTLHMFYGGQWHPPATDKDVADDLRKRLGVVDQLLVKERERVRQLRNWLILILSSAGTMEVARERQLHKVASKFELREERLDGVLRLRTRPIGLGEDVPDHPL